jgi:3-deoxy-manno-octulosonate cytidylyltransferase (CMP-KDO synthetase)
MLRETGRTLIEHTYMAACRAKRPSSIIVATDHDSIAAEVARFGGQAMMTDPNAASGTDRVAEVACHFPDVEIFVNVQGDEPEIDGVSIDRVIDLLAANHNSSVATMATPIRTERTLNDPSCVKVVMDQSSRAMYFSRSAVPHPRDGIGQLLDESTEPVFFQHMGLYAYRRDFLLQLGSLPRSPLEEIEKLEQLRFLSAGCTIEVGITDHPVQGIDTAEDYQAFVQRHAG